MSKITSSTVAPPAVPSQGLPLQDGVPLRSSHAVPSRPEHMTPSHHRLALILTGDGFGRDCQALHGYVPTLLPLRGSPIPGIGSPVAEMAEVASPLTLSEQWSAIAASPWIVRTNTRGYRLQFASVPPRFAGIISSLTRGEVARILQEEILSLLNRGKICIVHPILSQTGYYSRYFLVPGICPILDLRAINRHLRKHKFRMITQASLLHFVQQNDWFTSVDLKDVCSPLAFH